MIFAYLDGNLDVEKLVESKLNFIVQFQNQNLEEGENLKAEANHKMVSESTVHSVNSKKY